MGALADSVLKAGGNVTGVEPNFFIENEFQHDGLTKLIVTKDMSERKNKMIELGEAFIAFPGGTGTLEEIAEVMSKVSLKHLEAPCILYNLNGYYDDLKALLNHMIEKGLSSNERQEGIFFVENLDDIHAKPNNPITFNLCSSGSCLTTDTVLFSTSSSFCTALSCIRFFNAALSSSVIVFHTYPFLQTSILFFILNASDTLHDRFC